MVHQYNRMASSAMIMFALASLIAAGLMWAQWALPGGGSRTGIPWPVWGCLALAANLPLTLFSQRWKRTIVRLLQKYLINPPMRLMLLLGFMPLGYALLETRGRVSGKWRRTPVGNGLVGNTFWIVAEHGEQAEYVRNIRRDSQVRIKLRRGLRFVWLEGCAEVLPDDDPLARQRDLARWHPLRALNAVVVQLMSTELLTIRIAIRGA
jgi:deazaflavin-dependent oxidoreductase (nitroreductase family)